MLKEKKWTQDDINNLDLYERYSTMGKIYDEAAILAKQDGADSKNFIYKSSLNEMLRDMVKYRIDKTGEEELNLRSYIIDKLDKHDIKTDFNHIYSLSDQLNAFWWRRLFCRRCPLAESYRGSANLYLCGSRSFA